MRISRAIDKYLAQKQVESDWTPRTIDSVYRTLVKLADEQPETRLADLDGRAGTDVLRDHIGRHYGRLSSSTRATRISYFHSFFAWAEEEGYLDDDPSRRIKRPPKRRPDIYRPNPSELQLGENACTARELAPWVLMARRGFRAATVCALRWQDLDLQQGRVRISVKGGHRDIVPLRPAVTRILQRVYRQLEPEPDDYVFTVERELWISQEHRVRQTRDPKQPASPKALWAMVGRVCKRAGIRKLGPHALRHGFATGFLRETARDVFALQGLMGHSRIDTTEKYADELNLQELEAVLEALDADTSVADDDDTGTPGEDEPPPGDSGGGGDRTRVRPRSSSQHGRRETREDDEDDLERPKGRH